VRQRDLALEKGGDRSTVGGMGQRLQNLLVVCQVAISLVLLVGAGLTVRTVINLDNVPQGFNSENVLSMRISLASAFNDDQLRLDFYQRVLARVKSFPNVTAAAVARDFPLDGDPSGSRLTVIQVEGHSVTAGGESLEADLRVASADYFRTLEIPLKAGRMFTDADNVSAPRVVVINNSMARRYWGDGNAVGKRLHDEFTGEWSTIIGVVGDVKHHGLASEVTDEFYVPFAQNPLYGAFLLVRTKSDPKALVRPVVDAIHAIDPDQPASNIRTLEEARDEYLASPRLTAILLGLFAALAVIITAAGIGGVIGFSVSQRTREIGVRMALGAEKKNVLMMVLRQGVTLVAFGLFFGMAGAITLTRLISGLLFGVQPTDPLTFGVGILCFIAIAVIACLLPARTAATVDPMVALRTS
jgi:predicted permease